MQSERPTVSQARAVNLFFLSLICAILKPDREAFMNGYKRLVV